MSFSSVEKAQEARVQEAERKERFKNARSMWKQLDQKKMESTSVMFLSLSGSPLSLSLFLSLIFSLFLSISLIFSLFLSLSFSYIFSTSSSFLSLYYFFSLSLSLSFFF